MLSYQQWAVYHLQGYNLSENTDDINLYNELENNILEITTASPRGQWVNHLTDVNEKILQMLLREIKKIMNHARDFMRKQHK